MPRPRRPNAAVVVRQRARLVRHHRETEALGQPGCSLSSQPPSTRPSKGTGSIPVRGRGRPWRSSSSRCSPGSTRTEHRPLEGTTTFRARRSGRRGDVRTTRRARHRRQPPRSGPWRRRRSPALPGAGITGLLGTQTIPPDIAVDRPMRPASRAPARSPLHRRRPSAATMPPPPDPTITRSTVESHLVMSRPLGPPHELLQQRRKLAGSVDDCYGAEVTVEQRLEREVGEMIGNSNTLRYPPGGSGRPEGSSSGPSWSTSASRRGPRCSRLTTTSRWQTTSSTSASPRIKRPARLV